MHKKRRGAGRALPGTKVETPARAHYLWVGPEATAEPRALRTPPTQPDARTRHSGCSQGGAAAGFIQRRPQAFAGPRAHRPRHPLLEAPCLKATAAARSHRPPRPGSVRLRPSPACPPSCRPSPAGVSRDRVAGPQLRPKRSRAVGGSRG